MYTTVSLVAAIRNKVRRLARPPSGPDFPQRRRLRDISLFHRSSPEHTTTHSHSRSPTHSFVNKTLLRSRNRDGREEKRTSSLCTSHLAPPPSREVEEPPEVILGRFLPPPPAYAARRHTSGGFYSSAPSTGMLTCTRGASGENPRETRQPGKRRPGLTCGL